ncbi:MAG: DUF393 domain-containing protein [Planctomycetia bacterium]|nr:DUF393 domain-containing protein [Planctomycetia bacterium]
MPRQPFKLLYDSLCPICRTEVRWLQMWNRRGLLTFEDISAPGFDPARYGLTLDAVMGVMHGVHADGRVVTKVEAFRAAYRAVGLGWLLAPTAWPVLRPVCDWLYEVFARNRLRLGRLLGEKCEGDRCRIGRRSG